MASRDAVMTLEPPTWRFTSGNPATIKMFGAKSEEEFISYEPWKLSPKLQPDGRASDEKAKEMIETAMREGTHFFEWTHRRIGGGEFFAEVLLSRVEYGDKAFLYAVVRDITERKRADEKLREYEKKNFEAIFDNANDGMLLADTETKKFKLGNGAICRMLGYSLKELSTLGVADICPKENLSFVLEQFKKQSQGEIALVANIPVKRKDGSIFYADINSSTVVLDGTKYLLGIFRDTTERTLAEGAIQKSKALVEAIVEAIPSGILAVDGDGIVVRANGKFAEMWRIPNELLAAGKDKKLLEYVSDQLSEPDAFIAKVKELYSKPTAESFDVLYFKDGRIFERTSKPMLVAGTSQGRVWSFLDVTERKDTERKIIEDKAKDEAILDSIVAGVFACDTNGTIILFNRRAEELSGISAQKAIGRHYREAVTFMKEAGGKPSDDFIADAIVRDKTKKMANHMVLARKDGRGIPVAVSAAPFKNIQGRTIGCVVAFRDVTREIEIDEAKTSFISIAAHQLRTPVSGMNWLIEALYSLDSQTLSPQQKKYVKDLAVFSRRLSVLIEDLLKFSRIELKTGATKKQRVKFPELVEESIRELKAYADSKKHAVILDSMVSGPLVVEADEEAIHTALQNLIQNAIDYAPENTPITVHAEAAGDVVKISISNRGSMLMEEERSHLFEKFYRGQRAKKMKPEGTGLGLYIAKAVVESAGGTIGVRFEKDGDIVFWFTIPTT